MRSMLLISLVLVLVVAACGQDAGDSVSPQEAKKMIAKGDVVVLDVRTPGEWSSGHLEGAEHNNVYGDEFVEKLSKMDKDVTTIVYCRSGARSSRAQSVMKKQGFKSVINMTGGITGWVAMDYPIVQ